MGGSQICFLGVGKSDGWGRYMSGTGVVEQEILKGESTARDFQCILYFHVLTYLSTAFSSMIYLGLCPPRAAHLFSRGNEMLGTGSQNPKK